MIINDNSRKYKIKKINISTLQECCNEMIKGWTSNIKLERGDFEFQQKEKLKKETQTIINYLNNVIKPKFELSPNQIKNLKNKGYNI